MAEIGQLKREMQQTRALLVLSLLKRESAADRLQALDYSSDITQPDPEVLAALIKTLDIDPNINVRLAAVDALSNFSNEPSVRRAMALSLLKQQEAIVQMSLIDILTKLQDRQAIVQIKHLAENTDTPTQVRERAEESIKLLSL
jgi:HEAT repeat protein